MKLFPLLFSGLFCLLCSTANSEEIARENITCQVKDRPDEMVFVNACEYKDMSLLQAYSVYLAEMLSDAQKDFIQNPQPGQNKHINNLGNAMSVDYKWQGVNELSIEQFYAGGETQITFKYNGKDTSVITSAYPD
ncbi:hypothetical protein [Klebsiella spallanzanii]|uniref:hypothetical protein n=1 Tax=Klebsiella spallanzanii TaxID=2587528 RepID=UPI001157217F|nr:hypothetical protein [Klebsiella spallanzanii]VUS37644.1 hypothetical protein SB6419_02653 [Klebsiella spallanzanii]